MKMILFRPSFITSAASIVQSVVLFSILFTTVAQAAPQFPKPWFDVLDESPSAVASFDAPTVPDPPLSIIFDTADPVPTPPPGPIVANDANVVDTTSDVSMSSPTPSVSASATVSVTPSPVGTTTSGGSTQAPIGGIYTTLFFSAIASIYVLL